MKKKAAALKNDQVATGGGPQVEDQLTNYEGRALAILGKSFYLGVGKPESGVSSYLDLY